MKNKLGESELERTLYLAVRRRAIRDQLRMRERPTYVKRSRSEIEKVIAESNLG